MVENTGITIYELFRLFSAGCKSSRSTPSCPEMVGVAVFMPTVKRGQIGSHNSMRRPFSHIYDCDGQRSMIDHISQIFITVASSDA